MQPCPWCLRRHSLPSAGTKCAWVAVGPKSFSTFPCSERATTSNGSIAGSHRFNVAGVAGQIVFARRRRTRRHSEFCRCCEFTCTNGPFTEFITTSPLTEVISTCPSRILVSVTWPFKSLDVHMGVADVANVHSRVGAFQSHVAMKSFGMQGARWWSAASHWHRRAPELHSPRGRFRRLLRAEDGKQHPRDCRSGSGLLPLCRNK